MYVARTKLHVLQVLHKDCIIVTVLVVFIPIIISKLTCQLFEYFLFILPTFLILLRFCHLHRWLNRLITNNSIKYVRLNVHTVFVYRSIVNCTAGTYLDKKLGTCEDCAIGFYQERDAQVECVKCPPGTSTTEVRTDNSSSCLGTVFNFCML